MDNIEPEKLKEKKERVFKTKELVFTAIISFIIGAIITTAGFTIFGKHKGRDFKDFREDGIHRNLGPGEFNNNQRPNDNRQRMQEPNQDNQPNTQNIPNNQNAPAVQNNQNRS